MSSDIGCIHPIQAGSRWLVRFGPILRYLFLNVMAHPSSRWNRSVDGLYCHERKGPQSSRMHGIGR